MKTNLAILLLSLLMSFASLTVLGWSYSEYRNEYVSIPLMVVNPEKFSDELLTHVYAMETAKVHMNKSSIYREEILWFIAGVLLLSGVMTGLSGYQVLRALKTKKSAQRGGQPDVALRRQLP